MVFRPVPEKSLSSELVSTRLLDWYDQNARDLPWRVGPADRKLGILPDPYAVWMSVIMLQQTTIPHATRYFLDFQRRWSTVDALAAANRDDIMEAWAGLGYYSRARNLYKCAQEVASLGGFPDSSKELIKLPGIGPYTAGAIASIAFDEPVAAVDGNVERVTTRLLAIETPLKEAKPRIKEMVSDWVPAQRAGDFAQAMMDLGATLCTPKSPQCLLCPFLDVCAGHKSGEPGRFPVKGKKAPKPLRAGEAYICIQDGKLLAERRPDNGLLAGTLGLPTSDWVVVESIDNLPETKGCLGTIKHIFTHFELHLSVIECEDVRTDNPIWIPIENLNESGFPSAFRKALNLYQSFRKPD